jgi:hypothetical protein
MAVKITIDFIIKNIDDNDETPLPVSFLNEEDEEMISQGFMERPKIQPFTL